MMHEKLNEIEAAIIKRRLQYLKAQGATGKRGTHDLDKSVLDSMGDDWEFCSALADVYSVKEMLDRRHDRYRSDDDADTDQLYAESIVRYLLLDADTEPLAESSDAGEVKKTVAS